MNILVLAYAFPALSESFVVDHVRGLVAGGARVTVAATTIDTAALGALERRYGVSVSGLAIPIQPALGLPRLSRAIGAFYAGIGNIGTWLKSSDLRDAATWAPMVSRAIRRVRPDLVHAHFGPLGVSAVLAAKRSSIPVIVNFHGFDATVVPNRSGWTAYGPLKRHGVWLIAHSGFIAERLSSLELPVARVQMGYDNDVFYPAERTSSSWQRPLRLIQIGRLVHQKGQHIAIEAMALLRDRGIEARLCFVGAGQETDKLAQYCRVLDLSDRVEFAGALSPDDVAQKLRQSDVLLAPSLVSPDGAQEGFGRAVIEGIACGLPAVVFPTGSLPETAGDAGTVCAGTTALNLSNGIAATIAAGDRAHWKQRCVSVSAGRTLGAMWADYDRVTREVLAAATG